MSGNKTLSDEALEAIALSASGDARKALNLLEAVIAAYKNQNEVSLDDIKRLGDCLALSYDKNSDQHFDLISALIKSIRASHPDAGIYYLARMLAAGEDPNYIARRLLIAASEDIGNANPGAINRH
ncbi:MAG: hypothetical protein R3B45_13365 [Bdellovibrionota bacterium]